MFYVKIWYVPELEELVAGGKDIFEAALKFYFDEKYSVEYSVFTGLERYIPPERRQVNAKDFLLDPPVELNKKKPQVNIFLIDRDLFLPGFNYVFAVTNPALARIVISLFRLSRDYNLVNYVGEYKVKERLFKELMHELGHFIGLEHCDNLLCVMSFSRTLKELDNKVPYPCETCLERISSILNRIRRMDP